MWGPSNAPFALATFVWPTRITLTNLVAMYLEREQPQTPPDLKPASTILHAQRQDSQVLEPTTNMVDAQSQDAQVLESPNNMVSGHSRNSGNIEFAPSQRGSRTHHIQDV